MAVPLYLMEFQFRYTPVGASEPYYWCSWWHFSSIYFPAAADPAWNALIEAVALGTLDSVERVAFRWRDIANDSEMQIFNVPGTFGEIEDTGGGGLINVVRLEGRKDGKLVCYKRWRQPLQAADYDGVRLSTGTIAYYEENILPLLAVGQLCNVHRDIVDTWTVDPFIAQYQLRRGTKRRQGPVWPYA